MGKLFIDGSKLPYHLAELAAWKAGERVFPIHIEISPSSGCNQKCILCCVDFKGHKMHFLSEELLRKLPGELTECGVKSYLLAGEGEPLLNPHVADFTEACCRLGVDGALNSNAVLLTQELAERILPNLTWARFTMQSANPDRYSLIHNADKRQFGMAVENLRRAVEVKKRSDLKVTLGIQQILITENAGDVYETCKLAKEIGVDYFTVKRFCKHPLNAYDVEEDIYKDCMEQFDACGSLSDDKFSALVRWNQFANQQGKPYKRCLGLPFIAQLLANGKLYPCCHFFGTESMVFGDLNTQTFREAWQGERARAITKRIEDEQDVGQCMTYCRHHSVNIFLDSLANEPWHINFI